jgi:hypothetical protein
MASGKPGTGLQSNAPVQPTQRFLRFARALALVSGAAPFGCGGARPLDHVTMTDAAPEDSTTNTMNTHPMFCLGICIAPDARTSIDAGNDEPAVVPYDGGVVGIIAGTAPAPQPDAAADARDASRTDALPDAFPFERIPVGGPQAAPSWPAEWSTPGRA